MHNFNVAIADCSYMFRLLQIKHHQDAKHLKKEIISFYMSGKHIEDGYFWVAEKYNCSVQLLIFGPKRDEVTGEWRKLHNEELSDLYSLPNIVRVVKSRRMRWAWHVVRMGEGSVVHRVLMGKPEGKRPMGRPKRRLENNIKMDLQEMRGGCWDWMDLAQDRGRWRELVSTVRNLWVP